MNQVGDGGQADALYILSINKKTNHLTVIPISRDSMVYVDRYDSAGDYYDQQVMQLCLQYAYGKSHSESSELTLNKIEELFDGVTFAGYFTSNADIVPLVNDMIGGVSVTFDEDLTALDPAFKTGSRVTLNGEQAFQYIWSREDLGDNNSDRMNRQKNYLSQLIPTAKSAFKKNPALIFKLLHKSTDYTRTSLSNIDFLTLIWNGLQCDVNNMTITEYPGTLKSGEKYWEFYVDKEGLTELIVDTFYIIK